MRSTLPAKREPFASDCLARAVLLVALLGAASWVQAKDSRLGLRKAVTPMIEQKQFEEAIAVYVKAAADAADDNALQAHCLREASEIALHQLKDTERALSLAQQIRDPVLATSRRLVIHVQAQQFQKAIDLTDKIKMDAWPADVQLDSFSARGQAFAAVGQNDRAIADLDAASRCTGNLPRLVWSCYQLGQLLENHAKNRDGAMQAYERGVQATRANFAFRLRCFLRFTDMQLEQGKITEAIQALEATDPMTLANDVSRGELFLLQAKAYRCNKQPGTEATILTRILQLPGAIDAHKSAAQARLTQIAGEMSAGK